MECFCSNPVGGEASATNTAQVRILSRPALGSNYDLIAATVVPFDLLPEFAALPDAGTAVTNKNVGSRLLLNETIVPCVVTYATVISA
jgi:hypothetical protein